MVIRVGRVAVISKVQHREEIELQSGYSGSLKRNEHIFGISRCAGSVSGGQPERHCAVFAKKLQSGYSGISRSHGVFFTITRSGDFGSGGQPERHCAGSAITSGVAQVLAAEPLDYCLHPGGSTAQLSTAEYVGVFVKSTTGPCGVPSIWCASTNPLVLQGHRGAICGGYNLRLLSLVFEVQDATRKPIACKSGRFGGHKDENVKQGRAEIQNTLWCRSTSQLALPCEHRRMSKVEGECRRNTKGNRRVTFEVLMEPSQTDGAGPRGPTPVVTNGRLVFVLSGGAQCVLFVPPCPVLPADRQAGGRQARKARGHHQQQRTPQRHRKRAERRRTTNTAESTQQHRGNKRADRAEPDTARQSPPSRADATIS